MADAANIARRFRNGETVRAIAAELGCSVQSVYKRLRRAGIAIKRLRNPGALDPPQQGGRPSWSKPDAELRSLAREGRREIQAALAKMPPDA